MKQEAAVLRWIVEQQDRDAESNKYPNGSPYALPNNLDFW